MSREYMDNASIPPIEIIRIELTDVLAQKQISQKRTWEEYDPATLNTRRFLLPFNEDRFLYSPEAIADLHKQARLHSIEDAHITLIKQKLLCPIHDGVKQCFVPLHIARSFTYKGTRITGNYFISALHAIISILPENLKNVPWAQHLREVRNPLLLHERQMLIEFYMHAYLKSAAYCTDFTIISFPSKSLDQRATSPTHRAFSNLALPYAENNDCVRTNKNFDTYIFSHSNATNTVTRARELLADPLFIEQLTAFEWSRNNRKKQQSISDTDRQEPEFRFLYMQQMFLTIEWIRTTWRESYKLI